MSKRKLNKKRAYICLFTLIVIVALVVWGLASLIGHLFQQPSEPEQTVQTSGAAGAKTQTETKDEAQKEQKEKEARLEEIRAAEPGQIVDVSGLGEEEIQSLFTIEPVSDELLEYMNGSNWSAAQDFVTPDQLRYLRVLHKNEAGEDQIGEIIMNESVAQDASEIFQELYAIEYPITQMRLQDVFGVDEANMAANNTSGFAFRIKDNGVMRHEHSLGLAIDLNPLYNPQVILLDDGSTFVTPAAGAAYADRDQDFPMKIDREDPAYQIFINHGFAWGGEWTGREDYQHFEKGFDHILISYDEQGNPSPYVSATEEVVEEQE